MLCSTASFFKKKGKRQICCMQKQKESEARWPTSSLKSATARSSLDETLSSKKKITPKTKQKPKHHKLDYSTSIKYFTFLKGIPNFSKKQTDSSNKDFIFFKIVKEIGIEQTESVQAFLAALLTPKITIIGSK